jgi:hypothetical protein
MSISINGTSGLVFNDASTQATAATGFGFKNRIINGAMMIDQRNAGASVTPTTAETYTLDRWCAFTSAASKFSVQQNAGSVTPPAGFTKYIGVTSLSAFSLGASDYCLIGQRVEGFNISDFGWGAAGAATVTISFWVRSSLTGTFGATVSNNSNYSYPFTYTINSANTWEQKTVTIAGPTAGSWVYTNAVGLTIAFSLGAGSSVIGSAGSWSGTNYLGATGQTNMVSTNGATFYITGVQLEKGSTATSFDYRPYGTELQLCQRYYYKQQSVTNYTNFGMGRSYSTTGAQASMSLPVSMRAAPTGAYSALSDFNSAAGTITAMSPAGNIGSDFRWVMIDITQTGGATAQTIALNANNNNNAWMSWSAEL